MTVANEVINFYENFGMQAELEGGLAVHNPFDDAHRRAAMVDFFNKFYSDDAPRTHLLGINPSRFTDTSTGVNYTDGYALDQFCGIDNQFAKTRELTSHFFYQVVEFMGGAAQFYKSVFAWAVMPLSVTKGGEYKNYYEEEVYESISNIIFANMAWLQASIPTNGRAVILGTGDNKRTIEQIPGYPFGYSDIKVLPHPRWVMQYNSAKLDHFIGLYAKELA